MNPRVFAAIAEYLGQIHNQVIWPYVAERPAQIGAVNEWLIQVIEDASASVGVRCTRADECDQNEACIDGTCVPREQGLDLIFQSVTDPLPIRLERPAEIAIERSLTQAYTVIIAGLASNPGHLSKVRMVLMRAYAAAMRLTCRSLRDCANSCNCSEREECVDGVCVPVPFHLVLRAADAVTTPWAAR